MLPGASVVESEDGRVRLQLTYGREFAQAGGKEALPSPGRLTISTWCCATIESAHGMRLAC